MRTRCVPSVYDRMIAAMFHELISQPELHSSYCPERTRGQPGLSPVREQSSTPLSVGWLFGLQVDRQFVGDRNAPRFADERALPPARTMQRCRSLRVPVSPAAIPLRRGSQVLMVRIGEMQPNCMKSPTHLRI